MNFEVNSLAGSAKSLADLPEQVETSDASVSFVHALECKQRADPAQAEKKGPGADFESARSKQGAAAGYDRITALTEISGKVRQLGGAQLDLVGLYKGALGAVGELWAYGQRAIAASGEAGVAASWGIKKVRAPSPAVRGPRALVPGPDVPHAGAAHAEELGALPAAGGGPAAVRRRRPRPVRLLGRADAV